MLISMLRAIFGCSHNRTTFPLTRKTSAGARNGIYIVCLDCGREFDYNWQTMRIGAPIMAPVRKDHRNAA